MPSVYDLFQINPDEAEAIGYAARLSPAEGLMADRRLFQQRAVRGIEDLGRTTLGLPPVPLADRQSAAAELSALAQKVRPGTEEFYVQAIPILQKYNLPAEAEKMEEARLKLETGKGEMDPLMKMKRARDLLAKSPDAASPAGQAAIAAIDRKIAAYGAPPAKEGQDPEFIKLLNAYETALAAGQGDRAATLKRALDAWLKAKESSGAEVGMMRLALDKLKFELTEKKDTRKVEEAETAAVSQLQGAIRALDEEIAAATRLLAHPGRDKIIGPRIGALPDAAVAAISEDHGGAMALHLTLQGQTFIRALQDLKATSKTGASGLGQLTEVEGNKIQQAKAAISRQQGPAQFVRTLQAYLAALQSGRKVAETILTGKKGEVPVAPPIVADAPLKVDPRLAVPAAGKRTFKSTPVK